MPLVYWGRVDPFFPIPLYSILYTKLLSSSTNVFLKAGSSGRTGKRCRRSKSRTHFTHVKRSKSKIQQDVSIQINH